MATAKPDFNTKVVTDLVRFSYANIFQPRIQGDKKELKYSLSVVIRKDDAITLNKINKVIDALVEFAKTRLGGKLPKNFYMPLKDGDVERDNDEVYTNCRYVSANSKEKPGIIDKDMNEILDSGECKSGDYGRVSLNFFVFGLDDKTRTGGNVGIGVGLQNVQKLKTGEALSARSKAEDDFAEEYTGDLSSVDDDLM